MHGLIIENSIQIFNSCTANCCCRSAYYYYNEACPKNLEKMYIPLISRVFIYALRCSKSPFLYNYFVAIIVVAALHLVYIITTWHTNTCQQPIKCIQVYTQITRLSSSLKQFLEKNAAFIHFLFITTTTCSVIKSKNVQIKLKAKKRLKKGIKQ